MKMGSRVRSFVAVELTRELVNAVTAFRSDLERAGGRIRWVSPANLHLTLKFLGEIDREEIPQAVSIIEKAVEDAKPFDITLKGAGAFPDLSRPRVLWVGAEETGNTLPSVYNALNRDFSNLGVKREKKAYHPHITLGRSRDGMCPPALREKIEKGKERIFGSQNVSCIVLKMSQLTSQGPVYSDLARIALK